MTCEICELIKNEQNLIYKDNEFCAVMLNTGYSLIHIIVLPIKHYESIHEIPTELFKKMSLVVDFISKVVFEVFKSQGTNIFISEGQLAGQFISHFHVNIIPRFQDDNLSLEFNIDESAKAKLDETYSIFKNFDFSSITPIFQTKEEIPKTPEIKTITPETKTNITSQKKEEKKYNPNDLLKNNIFHRLP